MIHPGGCLSASAGRQSPRVPRRTCLSAGAIVPALWHALLGLFVAGFVLGGALHAAEGVDPDDLWSLAPVVRHDPPAVKDPAWPRGSIDHFVLSKLEAQGWHPAAQASRQRLVRRLYFDLWGLPPSPDDVRAFVADTSPDAYERLVDRLLDSPHYGERWGRHWLDVVRFGESHGYEMNGPRAGAWTYRDWVIAAFNNDMPLPQFVLAQLAGDQIGMDAATGILVG